MWPSRRPTCTTARSRPFAKWSSSTIAAPTPTMGSTRSSARSASRSEIWMTSSPSSKASRVTTSTNWSATPAAKRSEIRAATDDPRVPRTRERVAGAGLTATGVDFCLQACVTPVTWYRDADGDGHGAASSTTSSCTQPSGYVPAGDDCNDANAQIWGTPGEVRGLLFTDAQSFSWTPPASLGGLAVVYDALRTGNPADFVAAAPCVEPNDDSNTIAVDASLP